MRVDDGHGNGAQIEEQGEAELSPDMLKCYLQHVGLIRKKRRRRCLSAELFQLSGERAGGSREQAAGCASAI